MQLEDLKGGVLEKRTRIDAQRVHAQSAWSTAARRAVPARSPSAARVHRLECAKTSFRHGSENGPPCGWGARRRPDSEPGILLSGTARRTCADPHARSHDEAIRPDCDVLGVQNARGNELLGAATAASATLVAMLVARGRGRHALDRPAFRSRIDQTVGDDPGHSLAPGRAPDPHRRARPRESPD